MERHRTIISTRTLNTTAANILNAFADPALLSRWWGPEGFTNQFELFEFKQGGKWNFIMQAPDGTGYHNQSIFQEVSSSRIIIEHLGPVHHFILNISLTPQGSGTQIEWQMLFDTAEEMMSMRDMIIPANEQNFDRLARVLAV
jgi:uncharacterized protein YndB with AHSA1/START domain